MDGPYAFLLWCPGGYLPSQDCCRSVNPIPNMGQIMPTTLLLATPRIFRPSTGSGLLQSTKIRRPNKEIRRLQQYQCICIRVNWVVEFQKSCISFFSCFSQNQSCVCVRIVVKKRLSIKKLNLLYLKGFSKLKRSKNL